MNRRALKKEVFRILATDDISRIDVELAKFSPQPLITPLFSAICAPDPTIKWHGVWAMGRVVPKIAEQDFEAARIIMRRFLWSLNDESGGIGWGAPEAMAEIMAQQDKLAAEYLHMLISYTREDGSELFQDGNYLELPMLQRGLLWGIGRLCLARKQTMVDCSVPVGLKNYLTSDDRVVCGLAIWCLGILGESSAIDEVSIFAEDQTIITLFIDGKLVDFTISELVKTYPQPNL